MQGEVIPAAYDENDALKSIYSKPIEDEVLFDKIDLTNLHIKAMLWDGFDNAKPLSKCAEMQF